MTDAPLLPQPLTDSDLQIWCAPLEQPQQKVSTYYSLLAAGEIDRAERFYFERDRNHYIVGRGILRTLLGSYLNVTPAEIEFTYGAHGKPALRSKIQNKTLEFNLSHSKDMVLYAFAWNRKVGIDIEYIHPMPDIDDFAKQFFSASECAYLNSLTPDQKLIAFFKTWTCKEAFLKANGSGLTVPINEAETLLSIDDSAKLISIGKDIAGAARWRLEMFNPAAGYQAAVAIKGHTGQVIWRQLE